MRPRLRTLGTCAALTVLGCVVAASTAADDDDFALLVKDGDLATLQFVGIGPESVTIRDGVIAVAGKPNGYFATRESYRNYILRFEWMYDRPEGLESDAKFRGNSGLLLHIQEPHKVWPRCIEVQLQNASAGAILPLGGVRCTTRRDAAAQKQAIGPVGRWNRQEVTCRDGTILCAINGLEVAGATGASIDHGPIGWQSEGAPIRFRNIVLKKLD